LPLRGSTASSSSTWENLQRDISKIAFDIPTYKVASWCLRTGVTIRSRSFFFSCSGFVSAGLFVVLQPMIWEAYVQEIRTDGQT
jgi:hypothetical protein